MIPLLSIIIAGILVFTHINPHIKIHIAIIIVKTLDKLNCYVYTIHYDKLLLFNL